MRPSCANWILVYVDVAQLFSVNRDAQFSSDSVAVHALSEICFRGSEVWIWPWGGSYPGCVEVCQGQVRSRASSGFSFGWLRVSLQASHLLEILGTLKLSVEEA
jgi:hypothetical protein